MAAVSARIEWRLLNSSLGVRCFIKGAVRGASFERLAINTSILVSKRMLDGGIPAANDFFIAPGSCCQIQHPFLRIFACRTD
jgi:hypothetical protein